MHTDWNRAVALAAEVLAGGPELEDDEVVARLLAQRLSEHVARVAVTMVPIAFGRVLLSERGHTQTSGTFHVQDAGGNWIPFEFAVQPAFVEATQLAVTARHRNTIDRETFEAIGERSVEVGREEAAPVALVDVGPELFVRSKAWWKFW